MEDRPYDPTAAERRRSRVARLEFALAILFLGFTAWYGSCRLSTDKQGVVDNAFVTFTYARNLVEGHGLRFNATDALPTPGCSSELLLGYCAAAIALGFDPLIATRALSLFAVLAVGILLGLTAARVIHAPRGTGLLVGAAASWVLMVMPETGVHLATGMETMLFTLVHALTFAWVTWASARDPGPGLRATALGGLALAALVFTRPEGWILALLYTAALVLARVPRAGFASSLRECRPVLVVALALVVGMFAWRLWMYGALLPNAYYVKSSNAILGGSGSLLPGWTYVLRFVVLRLVPAILIVGLAAGALAFEARVWVPAVVLLTPSVLVLGLYSRAIHEMIGGFRYEYPLVVPWFGAGVAALVAFSLRSRITFRTLFVSAVFVVPAMAAPVRPALWEYVRHVRTNAIQWIDRRPYEVALSKAGLDLGSVGLGPKLKVLLSSPGHIPWYSRCTAIDWIGVNETRLSGREAMTIEEAWSYIVAQEPDVVQSLLPPAAETASTRATDANFRSKMVRNTLAGQGWGLVQHWDPARIGELAFRQMQWVREHCVFGACYRRDDSAEPERWVFLYVRADSPHREALLAALRGSKRTDLDSDLGKVLSFDPRRLTRE